MPRLRVELVPQTAWWSNVRSNISARDWEICKNFVKTRSGNKCEICGGQGKRWAVECHEIWEYDDERKKQTLIDLVALCPPCHQVKHFGRSLVVKAQWQLAQLIEHMCVVNGWEDPLTAENHVMVALEQYSNRSQYQWELDVSFLETVLGLELPETLDREKASNRDK